MSAANLDHTNAAFGFYGDNNTGMYRIAADRLGFTAGGHVLEIAQNKISGSSTSTGSFGHLHVAAQGSTYLATLGNDGLSVKGSSNSTGTNFRVRDGSGNTRFNVHGYGQTGIGTDSAQTMLHIVQTSAGLQNILSTNPLEICE